MATSFRIHPAIGIARLGNSPDKFCISPDKGGDLPVKCDDQGNPILNKKGEEESVKYFNDDKGRILRQAARFRVFIYDDKSPEGREAAIGDQVDIVNRRNGQLLTLRIDDIQWTAYLANKKASWYAFAETDGEHGYASDHPLRNADITNSEERQRLIIDPGPRTVSFTGSQQATFDKNSPGPTSFPPDLVPNSIATLGELRCTQMANKNRLLVLGGFGNSGTMLDGFGNPKIEEYANNDGWFDDISDGPVSARFIGTVVAIDKRTVKPLGKPVLAPAAIDPAWVIVGYPRYVPQAVDVVTMDDLLFDIAVRHFGYVPYLYGIPPFTGSAVVPKDEAGLRIWRAQAQWNTDFRPYFGRDILPILQRPLDAQNFMDADALTGGNPHNTNPGGNFDITDLSVPPYPDEPEADRCRRHRMRQLLYAVLRKPGQENELFAPAGPGIPGGKLFAMPLLCGDNALSNTAPSKFLRLTDTMLFLLKQWADGRFIDETSEDIKPGPMHPGPGAALDRGALAAALGGAFCPGAEAGWIMRNPAIYSAAYRIKPTPPSQGELSLPGGAELSGGLEPGDITKYSALPWQSDFNECTNQPIDITYRDWNNLELDSVGDPVAQAFQLTYWWPVHRPFIFNGAPWSPTAQNNAGDLAMTTAWASLRFIIQSDGQYTFAPTPPDQPKS